MGLLDFVLSTVIWFSPYSDADQPFGDMGVLGTIRFYLPFVLSLVL